MKSFNVVSIHLKENTEYYELNFSEGIIINSEIGEDPWLIEVSLKNSWKDRLEKYLNQDIDILVKITRPTNNPAHFVGKLVDINDVEEFISVIFKGHLETRDPNYPVDLLEELLDKGYSGEDLVDRFRQNLGTRKES